MEQILISSSVSPVFDQTAEQAAGGRQVEGGAETLKWMWPRLKCDHLDVQKVGQLDERQLTCQSTNQSKKLYLF